MYYFTAMFFFFFTEELHKSKNDQILNTIVFYAYIFILLKICYLLFICYVFDFTIYTNRKKEDKKTDILLQ